MTNLLANGLKISRSGSLLFVCGGNSADHLRPKFCTYARDKLPEFIIFQPEYAMIAYHSDQVGVPLNLGKFEELIAELSHAVILFPEAPGSFAETGYFAKTDGISLKTILVANTGFQKEDSFIMLGPARLFDTRSKFTPQILIDYKKPDFDAIISRVKRSPRSDTKKTISVSDLKKPYDLFCFLYKVFDLLRVATIEDVIFISNAVMRGRAPKNLIKELFTILIGSEFIKPVGEFGHYYAAGTHELAQIREGYVELEREVRLQVADALTRGGAEISALLEVIADAA